MGEIIKNQGHDKRVFPRMVAECPVLYRTSDKERWCVGILIDFSATGLQMTCNRELHPGTPISTRLERGNNKVLPALSGSGTVVRCIKISNTKFKVACKLTKIDPPAKRR